MGQSNEDAGRIDNPIVVNNVFSFFIYWTTKAEVKGLDQFPRDLWPALLPATTGAANDITLSRALSGPHTLAVGLVWWTFCMIPAVCYVVFVYSRFMGKSDLTAESH